MSELRTGEGSDAGRTWMRPLPRSSNLLPDLIDDRVGKLARERYEESMSCGDWEAWLERREALQRLLSRSLGLDPLPPRTALKARDLGIVRRQGYRIEKLTFESRPGCEVTAHLYVPEPLQAPAPAVLCSVGHWIENGKMQPIMQSLAIGLCRLGFVALVYDPLDQGERRENWHCHGHLEALLVGLSQAGLSVWESMRALDYLQSRPEVDGERLGMTGASGGGMNTLFTSAVDGRIKASVPVCYVNSAEHLLPTMRGYNWVGGQDLCNQVPGLLNYANVGDVCALVAPRPQLVINATQDPMFPVSGTVRAVALAQHIYALGGNERLISLALVEAGHGYDRSMRECAYGWFRHWLCGDRTAEPVSEPYHTVARPRFAIDYIDATADPRQAEPTEDSEASPEMYCFPSDSPRSSWGAITAIVGAIAEGLPPLHTPPTTLASWHEARDILNSSLMRLTAYGPKRHPHTPAIGYTQTTDGIAAHRVSFESEPGITIPAILYIRQEWTRHTPIALYLADRGKDDAIESGAVAQLLRCQMSVLVPDLRGAGETAASEFETATTSLMLDGDLFAQRLLDVRAAVDYLSDYSVIGPQIDKHRILCIGRGVAAMLALYAGAADERIAGVGAIDMPVSYKSLIVPHAIFSPSAYSFGVLKHFELAQVASLIAPRPLCIIDPLDGTGKAVDATMAVREYDWCFSVYRVLRAQEEFRIVSDQTADPAMRAARWLIHQTQTAERDES